MAIIDLFSKRQKKLRGEVSDVYQYEDLPQHFRVQVVHIIQDTIGNDERYDTSREIYTLLNDILCREYGVFSLEKNPRSQSDSIFKFFLKEENAEKCLDIIELSFRIINKVVRNEHHLFQVIPSVKLSADAAIEELNIRFKEAGVGYQFEENELIRVDSKFLHSDVVKPVLKILSARKEYIGVNDEFLSAHEHYRNKRYKECLNDCLKSFESLMKAIHDKHSWEYNSNDTAKKLINGCLINKLVPEYFQSQFSSIRALLESGIPTVRNKEGGHGQGTEITIVPEHLASYTLHLTATNLLFLAKCEEDLSIK